MSASMRGFRGRNAVSGDRKLSDQPENIGNRKTFDEIRIPPDNVGNKIDQDPIATFIHDGLGNSLDDEPSHLNSGILTHLTGTRGRTNARRQSRDQINSDRAIGRDHGHRQSANSAVAERSRPVKQQRMIRQSAEQRTDPSKAEAISGNDYMARLAKEFTKLLSERAGLPFSFSMKPVSDGAIDEEAELQSLASIKVLIVQILASASISASITVSQYRTANHRFAVFFVNPAERDPARNKDLISALRQVVKLHASRFSPGQVNILLVLANAQSVIEGHLYKIGAKKVDG